VGAGGWGIRAHVFVLAGLLSPCLGERKVAAAAAAAATAAAAAAAADPADRTPMRRGDAKKP